MSSRRLNDKQRRRNLSILYFLSIILAISSALPAYIQSGFLGQYISLQIIGSVFVIANAISVVSILSFPKIIKRLSNYFVSKIILILYGISLISLSLANSPLAAVGSIILFIITANLLWINIDIMVESFSHNESTGRTRTIYYTFINAGWILCPLASSYFINLGGYSLSFLIAALLVIPVFFILLKQQKNLKEKVVFEKTTLSKTIPRLWRDKDKRGIFFIALLLQIFYSSAVIYVPFYLLNDLGMGWEKIGPIFSIMLLPFILLQIPAGFIADKYIGEKEMLITGFLILSLSLFMFYYINTPTVWLWATVLFLSRIGAALIEAMRESYFFKIIDVENLNDIIIFRSSGPLGYIFASGLTVIILNFFSLNYLFLFLSVVMLTGIVFSATLKDSK